MIFHIPHSSRCVPADIRSSFVLSDEALRAELVAMTDAFTDHLFSFRAQDNDHVVTFPISRLAVDPERFLNDDDEPMSKVGMGVTYTRTSRGLRLRNPVDERERKRLIDLYYAPHHKALSEAVRVDLDRLGTALILDCHSFPSAPLSYEVDQSPDRPDLCIGTDSFHTRREQVSALSKAAKAQEFTVKIDAPFRGALVPAQYYRRDPRVQAVMLEINRALYMNEANGTKRDCFESVRARLGHVVHALRISIMENPEKGLKVT